MTEAEVAARAGEPRRDKQGKRETRRGYGEERRGEERREEERRRRRSRKREEREGQTHQKREGRGRQTRQRREEEKSRGEKRRGEERERREDKGKGEGPDTSHKCMLNARNGWHNLGICVSRAAREKEQGGEEQSGEGRRGAKRAPIL